MIAVLINVFFPFAILLGVNIIVVVCVVWWTPWRVLYNTVCGTEQNIDPMQIFKGNADYYAVVSCE